MKKVLYNAIEPAGAETGCLHYDLYRSVEDGNVFLFHASWRNEQAVELHGEQPHFKTILTDAEPRLAQPPERYKF